MNKKDRVVWAAFVNKFGLWYKKPIRVYWNDEMKSYWTKDCMSDFPDFKSDWHLVDRSSDNGYVAFASVREEDVWSFIQGALAVIKIIKNMSS